MDAAAAVVEGVFAGYNATLQIQVSSSNENSDTLASASSAFLSSDSVGFANRGIVGTKILSNGLTDGNGATADGTVDVNFFHTWDFDDDVAANAQDFKSTMIHELVHAVGFGATIAQNGQDPWGTNPGNEGLWAPYDEFIADSHGSLIGADAILDGARWNTASVGGTGATPAANGLYFIGPIAMAAFGGPVPLYSPTSFESGSSVHHLDDHFFNGTNGNEQQIMNATAFNGPGLRTLSSIELGVLRDIGFTAVPEPSHYVMAFSLALLALLALVAMRWRRSIPTTPVSI